MCPLVDMRCDILVIVFKKIYTLLLIIILIFDIKSILWSIIFVQFVTITKFVEYFLYL